MNRIISEIKSTALLAESLVSDIIPYVNMEIPDSSFMRFISKFLISSDGFRHEKDVMSRFSMAILMDPSEQIDSMDQIDSIFDDRLDNDPYAVIPRESYESPQQKMNEIMFIQDAAESKIESMINMIANVAKEDNFAESNSRVMNFSLLSLVILVIGLFAF